MDHSVRVGLGLVCLLAVSVPPCPAQGPVLGLTVLAPKNARAWIPTTQLVLRVELLHPGDVDDAASTRSLHLAPAGKAWPEAITLSVTGPDGKPVLWTFERSAPRGKQPLVLDHGSSAAMGFLLAADPARKVVPGRHTLRAVLEIKDGEGWRGRSESAPLEIEAALPEESPRALGISLAGGEALAPADPWVFAIDVPPPPPGTRDDDLRSGYTLKLHDAAGREVPVTPAPLACPPVLPAARDLAESGFGPVLAVLDPRATADLAPGRYRLGVEWRGTIAAAPVAGTLSFTILSASEAVGRAERGTALQHARLAQATALLWHAEFGNAAHVERYTTLAATVLLAAERAALDEYAKNPRDVRAVATLAEIFALQGDFAAALAFARVALGLWTPPPRAADELPAPPPEDLRRMAAELELRAEQSPGRVLPYLRTAVAAARGMAEANSPAPGAATRPSAPGPETALHQWASTARASSEYRGTDYGAAQATGAPDVPRAGDSPRAWAARLPDGGEEWLELTYAQAVHATEVRVIQSFQPGAIVRIDLIDASGAATTVWTGPDRTAYAAGTIGVLAATFPASTRAVARVRVVLDTKRVANWNEIDAVELVGDRR